MSNQPTTTAPGVQVSVAIESKQEQPSNHASDNQDDAVIQKNKAAILKGLTAAGVEKVECQYFGEGDSGGITEISISPKEEALLNQKIKYQKIDRKYVEGKWVSSTSI